MRGAGAKGFWRDGEGGGEGTSGTGEGAGAPPAAARGGGLAEAAQSLGPLTEGLGLFGTQLEGGAGGAGAYLPPLHSVGSSHVERALSERPSSEGPTVGMLSSQGSMLSDESDSLGRAMTLLDLERQGLSSSDAGLSTPEDSLPRHERVPVRGIPTAAIGRSTTPGEDVEWRHIPGLPAKTGTGYRLCENPLKDMLHVRGLPPEPLEEPEPGIAEQMVMHDAERIQVPGNVRNFVVYDAHQASASGGGGSTGGGSDAAGNGDAAGDLPSNYEPRGSDDHTLVLNSRFESGNLRRAIKVYDYEYDLILRPDLNTRGHTQWFYFSVSNTRRNQSYKLNIINLCKDESLYQEGMRPLLYSVKDSVARGTSWKRVGERICYYQNTIKRKCGKNYSTLTMTLRFEHDHDTVHLAHCYPYTYSDLQRYLHSLEMDPVRGQYMRRRALCKTLAGNNCDLLTITSYGAESASSVRGRKAVVLSARVHPGETNASWMMRGVLQFLTGPSFEAQLLRKNFIFKVIPMLNPDGVVNGNYRCSLTGDDLNRCWLDPSKKLHPTIWHTKAMMKKLQEDREVMMFCDFHGHSRKRNIFVYGCERKERDGGFHLGFPSYRIMEKVFPKILSDTAPDLFSMVESSFKVQKSKESTARVVCWRELGLTNSYTLEATFAGADSGAYAGMHFQTSHLEDMGEAFCKALLDYCNPDDHKLQSVYRELELMFPPRVSSLVGTYSSVDSSTQNSKLSDLSRDPSVHGAHSLGFAVGEDAGSDEDTDADSDVENGKGKKERRRRNSTKRASGAGGGGRTVKGTNGSGKAKASQSKGKSTLPKSSAVKRSEGPGSKKTKPKPSQKPGGSAKSKSTDPEGAKKKRPSLEEGRVKVASSKLSEKVKGGGAGSVSSDSKFSGVRLLKGQPRFPVGSGYVR